MQILRLLQKGSPFLIAVICFGCGDHGPSETDPASNPPAAQAGTATLSAMSPDDPQFAGIRTFCGNCHVFPQPESFPKSAWYDEVRRGFNFYYDSGRQDLSPPSQASVVTYFQQFAPVELPVADQKDSPDSPLSFHATEISMPDGVLAEAAAISFVELRPGLEEGETDLWLSDMNSGMAAQLADIGQYAAMDTTKAVGEVRFSYPGVVINPAAVRQVDLNGNGIDDLLLADLGSYLPEDHNRGKVVWIPDGVSATQGSPVTILDHVGRVADVQVGDFDNDGRTDVVVAEFGWHKTGGLHLLTNRMASDGTPMFKQTLLDDRSGTIHAIPTDVNRDGRLDILALISQEHEKIVAFINQADGFQKVTVYEAPDPSWGSSGMTLTDLDHDGDLDILYTNGDSFDSYLIKPYHGVWWLENQGTMPFKPHHLAAMPGVHRAIPSDLDADGDLDIVIAAMLPQSILDGLDVDPLHAIDWLERLPSGEFVRHVIERGQPKYAALTIGDINQDGFPDVVAGVFGDAPSAQSIVVKIYWNGRL